MRAKSEKRTVSKSLRMTEQLSDKLMKKAKEKNMSFGSYVVERLSHDDKLLTPEIISVIQEIVNQVNCCNVDSEQKDNIKMECEKLWELLR